jgi:hypothetical protein
VEAANLVIEEGATMVGAAKIRIGPEPAVQVAAPPSGEQVKVGSASG